MPRSPHETSPVGLAVAPAEDSAEPEDDATLAIPPTLEDGAPVVDDAAESEFLAEARARGEPVSSPAAATEPVEEVDSKALPKLDELVARIPPNVRDVLEDLFRARFVSVKRIPKKALLKAK
ncbi:hypothetical protein [Opitutus sp. ER46]|uniref:hypothetical protein n=1 Tax=Opitutus sp. ER46 TaxID=2161864 RepID=UPI0011B1F68D|nr:hypothetical protein [Opitutus sp. ER46]